MIGWFKDDPLPSATVLAKRVGVSQPRVSHVLAALETLDLATRADREWKVTDRAALLDR